MSEQETLKAALEQGVKQQVAPAMVLLLWKRGESLVLNAGQAQAETVFDLASLTKPLATALLALELSSKDIQPWEATLGQTWGQAVPEDKQTISIRQLLTHSAGYPAHQPYFNLLKERPQGQRKALLKAMLMNEPLAHPAGSAALYSDLGYMLLGLIMEQNLEMTLDKALARLYGGLDLDGPRYLPPDEKPPWPLEQIAPCGPLPGRREVHGQVEDENAHALGGVAGHAGLFGSAAQVAGVMQALMGAAKRNVAWPQDKAAAMLELDMQTPGSTRTPGFDTPCGQGCASGDQAPAGTVGHLGFTGCSLWWHPESDRGVVLLTNRVAYGRDNERIKDFRNQLHNLAWREMEE